MLEVSEEERTVTEVSDRLLVYPYAVMTAIRMLEREDKATKVIENPDIRDKTAS